MPSPFFFFLEQRVNVLFCGALCRQQRSRVHVPAEGPRGPEAGWESHAAVWSGQHTAGQRPCVLAEEPQVDMQFSHTHTHTHTHTHNLSEVCVLSTHACILSQLRKLSWKKLTLKPWQLTIRLFVFVLHSSAFSATQWSPCPPTQAWLAGCPIVTPCMPSSETTGRRKRFCST